MQLELLEGTVVIVDVAVDVDFVVVAVIVVALLVVTGRIIFSCGQ